MIESLTNRITFSVLEILSEIRNEICENQTFSYEFPENELNVLGSCIQSMVDLSVNELSIHYTGHSKFVSDGEYTKLSNRVIKDTEEYYSKITKLSIEKTEFVLENDYCIIQRLFLPCTCLEIKKNMIEIRLDLLKNAYINMFKEFRIEDSDIEPQPLLDTAFAKMLFFYYPSHDAKRNIKLFIKYLINNNLSDDIHKFNSLDLDFDSLNQEKIQDDEEIEFVNQKLKGNMEISSDEAFLFSMTKDINYEAFYRIIGTKVIQ